MCNNVYIYTAGCIRPLNNCLCQLEFLFERYTLLSIQLHISITSLCLQVVEETGPWKDVLLTKTFAATPSAALATILPTLEHWWYVFVFVIVGYSNSVNRYINIIT